MPDMPIARLLMAMGRTMTAVCEGCVVFGGLEGVEI
jgi:hypothetical protein